MKLAVSIIMAGLALSATLWAGQNRSADSPNQAGRSMVMQKVPIIFATYASDDEALHWALVMAESIRQFGGDMCGAPIWVYRPEDRSPADSILLKKAAALKVIIKPSRTPSEAGEFWFAGKVYASAAAETDADGKCIILAWLDPDEIFVQEPKEFMLAEGIDFGYRPVIHKVIGSIYAEPPDEFWSRVYSRLSVPESAVFPVVSPVDQLTLRAYFNAGVLIVRPERGLLRAWPGSFRTLYTDSVFVEWCRTDQRRAIFLHQAALAGHVLTRLKLSEMKELPSTYNYPAFFHDRYPTDKRPASLDDVAMFRHEFFSPGRQYMDILAVDRSRIIDWVKQRLPKK